jgi:Rieske Fe-S protein
MTHGQEGTGDMKDECNPERRTFLKTAALAGAVAVVSGVPLLSYVVAPALERRPGTWFDFGPREKVAAGVTMLSFKLMAKDGWVTLPRQGFAWAKTAADGTLTVFSATCTHLNCTVTWRDTEKCFHCPCHSGRFDADGRPVSGPPTRPLTVLEHRVEDGKLLVLLPA